MAVGGKAIEKIFYASLLGVIIISIVTVLSLTRQNQTLKSENAVLRQSLAQLARENTESKITHIPHEYDTAGKGIIGLVLDGRYIFQVPGAASIAANDVSTTIFKSYHGGPPPAKIYEVMQDGKKRLGYVQVLPR